MIFEGEDSAAEVTTIDERHLHDAISIEASAIIAGEVGVEIATKNEVAVVSVMTSDVADGESDLVSDLASDNLTLFGVRDMPSTKQNCWRLPIKMPLSCSIATI